MHIADLHNVHHLTDKLYCGSGPGDEKQLKALAEFGIKTVISVDGAKPRADLAEKYGLRYVHLPFGYDGIPHQRELEIARAVRDLPGPIYLHCHHGKHRGPAAAVVAAEATAGWTPEQAVAALHELGTSPHYLGLYAAARDFHAPTASEMDHVDASFPRVARINDLADTMVEIDERSDQLKAAQKAGWAAPKDRPDIDPPHEALMLRELLREAHRPGGAAADRPEDLRKQLEAAEQSAAAMEAALRAEDRVGADAAMKSLQNSCTMCHNRHRDTAKPSPGVSLRSTPG